MPAERLHPDDLAAITAVVRYELRETRRQVLDLLREQFGPASPSELLTTAEVAARARTSERWVRERQDVLGVVRLGDGPKPRLRFDPAKVEAYLTGQPRAGAPPARKPGRPRRRQGPDGMRDGRR